MPGTPPLESMEETFFVRAREPKRFKADEAVLPKQNVEYGVLKGWLGRKKHVELVVRLEQSVYRPGDQVRPVVES